MAELKRSEIRLIENFVAWPSGIGYVLDFSDRTFSEFFEDEFRVDIDDQVYHKRGSSKRHRLISFCLDAPAPLVAQVLRKLSSHRRARANESWLAPEDGLEAEFEALIQTIETRGDEPRTDAIDRYAVDRTLDELVADLNRTLESNKPEAAMDHLHTYCMKKFAFLLDERGESCAENEALHARFGRYRKILMSEQDLQPVTDLAMKSAISIFEKFNDVRNHHSLAHDSVILSHHEARYVFDVVTAVLRLLKALEAGRFETSK